MSLRARMFIDKRDGDGLCSHNPGEVFFWLLSKRPREVYRSAEFAQLADLVHYRVVPSELRALADAYQLVII